MKNVFIILMGLFMGTPVFGQEYIALLHTNVAHNIIGNPNLHLEKRIAGPVSVSLELMYLRYSWTANNSFPLYGSYYHSSGYLLGLAPRFYAEMYKKAPNAWYFSPMFRYSHANFSQITYYDSDMSEDYDYRAGVTEDEYEFGIVFGRTFFLWKPVTVDVYLGTGVGFGECNRTFIDGHFEKFVEYERNDLKKLYLGCKVGYCFGTRKKSDAPMDQ